MTRHPIMIAPSAAASEAERLLAENNIRHLPVVEDGKRLVGLITRNRLALKPDMLASLNVWEITRSLANLKAKDVMVRRRSIHTIAADRSVERAAATMSEHKIGCLPVVDEDDAVVGIVTEIDIFHSLQEMLGLSMDGIRVTVRMPNRKGEFAKLTKAIADQEWGVIGIGSFPTRKDPDHYDVVVKIPNVTLEDVRAELSKVPDQEVVDIRAIV